MNVLFYIDAVNFDIKKLSRHFGEKNNNIIFVTSYQTYITWKDKYPLYYYENLGMDAAKGFYIGRLAQSYQITSRILEYFHTKLNIDQDRKELVTAIPQKVHRVISEALRAHLVVDAVISRFKPQMVYTLKKPETTNIWYLMGADNFESDILREYCDKKNIEHKIIPVYAQRSAEYFLYRIKKKIKYFNMLSLDRIFARLKNRLSHSVKLNTLSKDTKVILVYIAGHMFYRNQIIWKFFNEDKNHCFLCLTDHLNEEQKNILDEYSSLNYIHFNGLLPVHNRITDDIRKQTDTAVDKSLGVDLPFARNIITKYLSHYIFGMFDNHITNHHYIKSLISPYHITEAIFSSYWEIQPSLLITHLKNRGVPTTAIQAGLNPRDAKEVSLTDRYAVYGQWDFQNFLSSGMKREHLFISGWPLGSYYQSIKFENKSNPNTGLNILYLLSMGGSWQYFLNFPEDSILRDIFDVAELFHGVNFTIRTHAGNNNKKFIKMIKESRLNNIRLDNSGSLLDAFKNTDFTFTQTTTAGFESMVLNVPTFYLGLYADESASPFSKFNPRYKAGTKEDLISILRALQNDPGDFLRDYDATKLNLLRHFSNPEFAYNKLIST